MKIDGYSFGQIVIGGERYTSDVIVYHDRVRSNWWRRSGHSLCVEDLKEVFPLKPKTLIVGKGAAGMVRIPGETEEEIRKRDIKLVALRTGQAVEEYNRHAGEKDVVGAFHLTC